MDVPFDVAAYKIETKRVVMRPFTTEDLADVYAFASVPGVGEMAGWPHHKTKEASEEMLRGFIEKSDSFAVYHRADEKVIGYLALHGSWTSRNEAYKHLSAKEVGCVIAKPYWGQGLASEILEATIEFGFDVLGLDALAIAHIAENTTSRRVAEKMGFTYIETGVYYSKRLDKSFDDIRHILLKPPIGDLCENLQ